MSISTARACLPEIRRRPVIRTAFAAPRATIAQTKSQSSCVSRGAIAWSITFFVTQISATCAACEATASAIETPSPTRYGVRKPSSRKNVVRFAGAVATKARVVTHYGHGAAGDPLRQERRRLDRVPGHGRRPLRPRLHPGIHLECRARLDDPATRCAIR